MNEYDYIVIYNKEILPSKYVLLSTKLRITISKVCKTKIFYSLFYYCKLLILKNCPISKIDKQFFLYGNNMVFRKDLRVNRSVVLMRGEFSSGEFRSSLRCQETNLPLGLIAAKLLTTFCYKQLGKMILIQTKYKTTNLYCDKLLYTYAKNSSGNQRRGIRLRSA